MNNVTLRRLAQAVLQHQARARERARASGIVVPVGVLGCAQRTKKELSALIRSKLGEPWEWVTRTHGKRLFSLSVFFSGLGGCVTVVVLSQKRCKLPALHTSYDFCRCSVLCRRRFPPSHSYLPPLPAPVSRAKTSVRGQYETAPVLA